jgi:hypothetical protein
MTQILDGSGHGSLDGFRGFRGSRGSGFRGSGVPGFKVQVQGARVERRHLFYLGTLEGVG